MDRSSHHRTYYDHRRSPQEKDHRSSNSSHRRHRQDSRSRSPGPSEERRKRKSPEDQRQPHPPGQQQTAQPPPVILSSKPTALPSTVNSTIRHGSVSSNSSSGGSVQLQRLVPPARPFPQKRPQPPLSVARLPPIPKKPKISAAPTPPPAPPVRIRPASFLVPPLPKDTPVANPAALQNYPRQLTLEQMSQRYNKAAEEKKKQEDARKKKQMIPALSNRKKPQQLQKPKIPAVTADKPQMQPVRPPSTASVVANSSHQSIYSSDTDSRPQSVASFFDDIEAMSPGGPVSPAAPVQVTAQQNDNGNDLEDSPEAEYNQVRVDRWQKGFDKTIYTVSHSQGKAKEQLNLPLLEDNEVIISIVNKGRHVMSVRPGPVETALVDFRSVIRVFKKGSPVVHDVFFKPKPDLSVEVKDLEKIASWCHNWLKSGKR